MNFNAPVMIVVSICYIIVIFIAIYILGKYLSKKKVIKEFSLFDLSQMDEIIFKIPMIYKIIVCLQFIIFLFPGLFLLSITFNITIPRTQNYNEFILSFLIVIGVVFVLIGIFSACKLVDIFVSQIEIIDNKLFINRLRKASNLDLNEINEVLEYQVGYQYYTNQVNMIKIKLKNGQTKIVNTKLFEPWQILKLVAYLNNKALVKNDNLHLSDFFKTR